MNIISKIFGAKPGDSDAADKIETAEEAPVVEPTDLDGPLPSTFGELLPILTRLGFTEVATIWRLEERR